jgi:hypothetical protein
MKSCYYTTQYKHMYSQICIKRSPMVERKKRPYKTGDLLREVQFLRNFL